MIRKHNGAPALLSPAMSPNSFLWSHMGYVYTQEELRKKFWGAYTLTLLVKMRNYKLNVHIIRKKNILIFTA